MKKENSLESVNKMEETSPTAVSKPAVKFDPYQASLQSEEEEVKRRSEKEDQETFASICKQLKAFMKEILKLKTEKPEQWATEVEDKKVKVLMLMLSLRRLSRIQKVRVKDSREKSADFRQGVDGITLQLQNLLYEVSHLKKEVRKCLEFQSADSEIDLVPVDQFYLEAPETISRPEETVEDVHQQRLAQLHWELEQRRGQTQLSDKLTQEKEKVAEIINEQEGKLASLVPRINTILEATKPLQKSLNLPLDAKREQQRTSQLLAIPLYTLWVQASAYAEACDSSLRIAIEGDAEAARKLVTPDEEERTDASESEGELEHQDDNAQRKSRNRSDKKNQDSEDSEDAASMKQLLSLHPLCVVLTTKTKDNNSISIKFLYALTLRIVTIKCTLELEETSKPLLVDILDSDSLLNLLFPEDTGAESPNPATEYQLQKLRLSSLTPDQWKVIGKPYKWGQTLSGLSFLSSESPSAAPEATPNGLRGEDKDDEDEDENSAPVYEESTLKMRKQCCETLSWKVSAEHMHHTISAIKRRLQSRLSLYSQFLVLETAASTSDIPISADTLQQLFPGKVCSELQSWKPITWTDYESSPATQHIIQCGAINAHFLPFKATFQRQSVTLDAYVAISPDYPNVAPIFALKVFWHKEDTATSNPHIRQMESELNTHFGELVSNRSDRFHLLSLQLYRLAMCLDILTEATSIQVEPSQASSQAQFHKEKIFFRPARGPDRVLPFKYLPKLGVFAQR